MAAIDTRTGKVLWEVWRPDELPKDTPAEVKTGVEYLLREGSGLNGPLPKVTNLPGIAVDTLKIKGGWSNGRGVFTRASEGKTHNYYRHSEGVIALDRKTEQEVWRLETTRFPYPSVVLEAGENLALVQIGSNTPRTLHSCLIGGGEFQLRMYGMEPHTLPQRVAAAHLLHLSGESYLRPQVKELVAQLRKEKDDPAAATAAKAVEGLLADWPKTRDRGRLAEGCVAALVGAADGNPLKDFAWKDGYRVVGWCLLQELVFGSPRDGYSRQGTNYSYNEWHERSLSLSDAAKKKLVAHCRKVVAGKVDREKPFAASVLLSKLVGWAELTDAELKTMFLLKEPSAWRWTALALSTNGRRKDLLKWIGERPDDDHFDVIWLLTRDRKGWPEDELKFWLSCARRRPGFIADALDRNEKEVAPTEFREPIRDFLAKEIANPTVKDLNTTGGGGVFSALAVLDRWKDDTDTPLIRDYLTHPARSMGTRYNGGQGIEYCEYSFRDWARRLLEKRGVKVPPDIVYKEDLGPAKR